MPLKTLLNWFQFYLKKNPHVLITPFITVRLWKYSFYNVLWKLIRFRTVLFSEQVFAHAKSFIISIKNICIGRKNVTVQITIFIFIKTFLLRTCIHLLLHFFSKFFNIQNKCIFFIILLLFVKVNFVSEQYDFFLKKMSMQTFSTMLGFCEVMQIQVAHPQVSEKSDL